MSVKSSTLSETQSPVVTTDQGATVQTSRSGGQVAIVLALLALYVIWGSTYLAIRIGVQTIPPFMMAGARFIVAGGIMFLFLRWRGVPMPTRAQWGGAFLVGSLLLVGGNGLVSFAEQWVPSSLAALGVATTPIWAALFAGLWGRWPVRLEWVGLGLGFIGVVVLNLEGDLSGNPIGAIALILAAMSWAFGSIWSSRLTLPAGPMSSAAQMLCAGVALAAISLITGERLTVTPSLESVGAVLYLVFFGAIVAYTAYGFLLRNVTPSLATSYAYVNPAVAVALGVWLLGENITWTTIAAMVIILAGVGVLALTRSKAKAGQH